MAAACATVKTMCVCACKIHQSAWEEEQCAGIKEVYLNAQKVLIWHYVWAVFLPPRVGTCSQLVAEEWLGVLPAGVSVSKRPTGLP